MKAKEVASIAKRIATLVPSLESKGPIIYMPPIDWILRGFYLDASQQNKIGFCIEAFVLPLYVPTKVIYFNLGKRLAGNSGAQWKIGQENLEARMVDSIRTEGLPFIKGASTPPDLISWIEGLVDRNGPYTRQAYAYSLAAAHRFNEAQLALSELIASLDPKVPWMTEMSQRAKNLSNLLRIEGNEVEAQLRQWCDQTKLALKL